MAQALLHGPQSVVSSVDEDHAGGIEAGASQCRRIQVPSSRDPQHRAGTAGQHPSSKQRRGGTMLNGGATSKQFVHRTQGKTLAGQTNVQLRNTERQAGGRRSGTGSALQRRELRAQGCDGPCLHAPRLPDPEPHHQRTYREQTGSGKRFFAGFRPKQAKDSAIRQMQCDLHLVAERQVIAVGDRGNPVPYRDHIC